MSLVTLKALAKQLSVPRQLLNFWLIGKWLGINKLLGRNSKVQT
jgi:hypothetical protein